MRNLTLTYPEKPMSRALTCLALLLASLMVGCASYAPHASLVGADRNAVIAAMGAPSRERAMPDGRRMEYPRGQNTYFVSLDRAGKVLSWENVLTSANYDKIQPGMSADEVERLIGPAMTRWSVARGDLSVWNYPFQRSVCKLFQLTVSPQGRVVSAGHGYDPDCDSSW